MERGEYIVDIPLLQSDDEQGCADARPMCPAAWAQLGVCGEAARVPGAVPRMLVTGRASMRVRPGRSRLKASKTSHAGRDGGREERPTAAQASDAEASDAEASAASSGASSPARPPGGWSWRQRGHASADVDARGRRRVRLLSPPERWARARRMRNRLPRLHARGVRRHREPLCDVLEDELRADGFPAAADAIARLLQLNDLLLLASQQVKLRWEVCHLREPPQEQLLAELAEGFALAESAGTAEDVWGGAARADVLLNLSLRSLARGETFYWLTEQLLLRTIAAAAAFRLDGGLREARARYAYGFVLAAKIGHMEFAREELDQARALCMGRSWTLELERAGVDAAHPDDAWLSVTDLLARVLLQLARTERKYDPLRAARYASAALRRLGHPRLQRLQALALVELGVCYEVLHEYNRAVAVLQLYLRMPYTAHDPGSDCSAYVELSYCYRHMGNVEMARRCLSMVLESAQAAGRKSKTTLAGKRLLGRACEAVLQTAQRADRKEMVAVAHRFLGEGLLMLGLFREASDHLEKAMRLFLPMQQWKDVDRVRVLHAITKGCEIMPLMKRLLYDAIDFPRGPHLRRLLRWKLFHVPFWNLLSESSPRVPAGDLFHIVVDSPADERRVRARGARAASARSGGEEEGEGFEGEEGDDEATLAATARALQRMMEQAGTDLEEEESDGEGGAPEDADAAAEREQKEQAESPRRARSRSRAASRARVRTPAASPARSRGRSRAASQRSRASRMSVRSRASASPQRPPRGPSVRKSVRKSVCKSTRKSRRSEVGEAERRKLEQTLREANERIQQALRTQRHSHVDKWLPSSRSPRSSLVTGDHS